MRFSCSSDWFTGCVLMPHPHIYFEAVGAASAVISAKVCGNWAMQHLSPWADAEVKRIEEGAKAGAGDSAAARTP